MSDDVQRVALGLWRGWVFGAGLELLAEGWSDDPLVSAAREHAWAARDRELSELLSDAVVESLANVLEPLATLVVDDPRSAPLADVMVRATLDGIEAVAQAWVAQARAVLDG